MIPSYDIYRGVLTGYNKAFIVDEKVRSALVAQDPRSDAILKPVLRGRDVQRYRAQWAKLWLIDTHNGYGDVPHINVDDYPAIKDHLDGFYERLVLRQDKGRTPYNLRNCAYHEAFSREKLYWRRVAKDGLFSYVEEEIQCVNAVYMLSGKSLKYLCAVLNSRLISWLMQRLLPTSGTGTFHWEKVHVERLPVPQLPTTGQYPFIRLVEKILHEKASSRKTQVCELERAINREVYALYDLTPSEILALEDTAT